MKAAFALAGARRFFLFGGQDADLWRSFGPRRRLATFSRGDGAYGDPPFRRQVVNLHRNPYPPKVKTNPGAATFERATAPGFGGTRPGLAQPYYLKSRDGFQDA